MQNLTAALRLLPVLIVVAVCLAFDWMRAARLSWLGMDRALEECFAVVHSPDLQWWLVACVLVYCVCFAWMNWVISLSGRGRLVCGMALVLLGVIRYVRNYAHASMATDTLVLCFGVALFGGIFFGRALEFNYAKHPRLSAILLGMVLTVFCLALLTDNSTGQAFSYRGQARWSGRWDNPNTFGVLMAVGVVLAVGWAVSGVRCQVSGDKEAESRKWKAEIGRWVGIALLAAAAVGCGVGLVKSYSRGAWLGAVCGLGFIGYQVVRCQVSGAAKTESRKQKVEISCSSCVSWFRRNWLPVAAIVVSVVALGFWNWRHTERTFARRVASVANARDFSSRNRVAAWVGALQMLAGKPWLGFGWNQPERVYEELYCPPNVPEAMAIQLNDYFTLGITLGIPALVCFIAFVGLNLTRSAECGIRNEEEAPHPGPLRRPIPNSLIRRADTFSHPMGEGNPASEGQAARKSRHPSLELACRAGVLVLLVGFWFDGGLFKLPTSSVFWILLALGSGGEIAGSESRLESSGTHRPV